MTTFSNVSYSDFKSSASSFFKRTEDRSAVTLEQAENGTKAIALLWLGRSEWTDIQIHESKIILNLVTRREAEVELASAYGAGGNN